MPPRYAYWTIIVDDQPTAFRAGSQDDLMPTFKRLKEKHPSSRMMWFQNGKLWPSRLDAQEAMRARGEMGRKGDERQAFRDRRPRDEKPEWKPKSFAAEGRERRRSAPASEGGPRSPEKLVWKPKGEFAPAPRRSAKPDWKPKGASWKPKGSSFDRERKPAWKPKREFTPSADRSDKPEWKAKGDFIPAPRKSAFDRERKPAWGSNASTQARKRTPGSARPEWKPKASAQDEGSTASEKRKWIPKEEYKKSMGLEARRDKNWRPGGAHQDPRQKYKDAKKAKWTKFKKAIRTRAAGKKKDS